MRLFALPFALFVLPIAAHASDCALRPPPARFVQLDYTGECAGGFAHGHGVALFQLPDETQDDVVRYEGEFDDGIPQGQGVVTSKSGRFGFRGEMKQWERWNGVAFEPYGFLRIEEKTFWNGQLVKSEVKPKPKEVDRRGTAQDAGDTHPLAPIGHALGQLNRVLSGISAQLQGAASPRSTPALTSPPAAYSNSPPVAYPHSTTAAAPATMEHWASPPVISSQYGTSPPVGYSHSTTTPPGRMAYGTSPPVTYSQTAPSPPVTYSQTIPSPPTRSSTYSTSPPGGYSQTVPAPATRSTTYGTSPPVTYSQTAPSPPVTYSQSLSNAPSTSTRYGTSAPATYSQAVSSPPVAQSQYGYSTAPKHSSIAAAPAIQTAPFETEPSASRGPSTEKSSHQDARSHPEVTQLNGGSASVRTSPSESAMRAPSASADSKPSVGRMLVESEKKAFATAGSMVATDVVEIGKGGVSLAKEAIGGTTAIGKATLSAAAHPVEAAKDVGRGVSQAGATVANAVTHPVDAYGRYENAVNSAFTAEYEKGHAAGLANNQAVKEGRWDDASRTSLPYAVQLVPAGKLGVEAKAITAEIKEVAKRAVIARGSAVTIDVAQLQSKFKHAADFGIFGKWNSSSAAAFETAIREHLASPATQAIKGTLRGESVTHYFNPQTGLNVVADDAGKFVSGWKLTTEQIGNVLATGKLGGN